LVSVFGIGRSTVRKRGGHTSGTGPLAGVGQRFGMKPILLAILAGLFWGVGEICAKMLLHDHKVGPFTLLMVRCAVAFPLALGVYVVASKFYATEVAGWTKSDLGVWLKLLLGAGLCAGFLGVLCFYTAMSLPGGEIGRIKPIAFTIAPATAAILGWLILNEAMTVRKVVALIMIGVAVVLLTYNPVKSGAVNEDHAKEGIGHAQ